MKLPILRYHNVSSDGYRDDLTVSKEQLKEHFQYLWSKGYSTIGLSELIAYHKYKTPLPQKPIMITFDDGFKSNYDLAYPLAKAYGLKINLFLVPAFMLRGVYMDQPCLRSEEIKLMDPTLVQVGLHSFAHQRYAEQSLTQIGSDIDLCKRYMEGSGIPYQPCLSYPYGAYPQRKGYPLSKGYLRAGISDVLDEKGIHLAFGIGNRLNDLPLCNPLLIRRCDIKGGTSFGMFKWRLGRHPDI